MRSSITTRHGLVGVHQVLSPSPDAEPVLVVPGFLEGPAHNEGLLHALASLDNNGFNATTFDQPRRHIADGTPLSSGPIRRQGEIVLAVINAMNPDDEANTEGGVHVVAHSLGAAAVLSAAQEAPENSIKSIILMQPVGMAGEQSFFELAWRSTKKVVNNQLSALRSQDPNRMAKKHYEESAAQYLARVAKERMAKRTGVPQGQNLTKPAETHYAAIVDTESATHFSYRTAKAHLAAFMVGMTNLHLVLKEALAAGKYDLASEVEKVTAMGIPVHVVTARSDEMFDYEEAHDRYKAKVAETIHGKTADDEAKVAETSYSSVAHPEARHDNLWQQPKRAAVIVEQILHKR
jgi:pimeloyl-ACP methyl ester carboxylesterase